MDPFQPQKQSAALPIAIVVGFALIALAIYFTSGGKAEAPAPTTEDPDAPVVGMPRPVDETDYIRGNPNAPILIVEYSDYDCPFCKQYHETLTQIMDDYGVGGKVAWVYRQLPIQKLHPNAPKISEAALCVGSIGGNDAFWKFTDLIFEDREYDQFTNVVLLPEYAVEAGVAREAYISCMNKGDMEDEVRKSVEDGFALGAQGTPYTVLMVGSEQAVINGAQPYPVVQGIIKNLLDQLEGTYTTQNTAPTSTSTPAR